MSPTADLSAFVSALEYEDVPPDVRGRATAAITDLVGVAVAGADRDAGQRIRSYVEAAHPGESSTVFDGARAAAPGAALANGTLGEVMSYDDTFESMVIHPSAPVLPAVLAAAEPSGATGRQVITGYVAGVEAAFRIGSSTHPAHYSHGWHSTGTIGTFGAAAGAAAILGLDADSVAGALGIAGSSAAGIRKNSGTMTFSLHAGHAAQMGHRAARLAAGGFSGDRTVFEGERNYGDVTTPGGEYRPDEIRPTVEEAWGVSDIGLKAYPCARVPQAAMDGLRDLLRDESLDAGEVRRVVVNLDPSLAGILDRPDPDDWIAARGSIEFCLGVVLAEGRARIDHFSDEYLEAGEVGDSLPKIEPRYDEPLGEGFSKYGARLTVETVDSTRYGVCVTDAPGSPANPLGADRRRQKFLECVAPRFGERTAGRLFDLLSSLEEPNALERALSLLRTA